MFICAPCLNQRYKNQPSFTQSSGRCEVCGENASCSDIPSSQLELKPEFDEPHPCEGCVDCTLAEAGLQPGFLHCKTCLAAGEPSGQMEVIKQGHEIILVCPTCKQVAGSFVVESETLELVEKKIEQFAAPFFEDPLRERIPNGELMQFLAEVLQIMGKLSDG